MYQGTDIKQLSLQELKDILIANNFPEFHATQIFEWIYKRFAVSFSNMTNLPKTLRQFLESRFVVSLSALKHTFISKDGTKKFVVSLYDNSIIETAYIPSQKRNTLCVSSQVGCKFNCSFCASTSCPWVRNLSSGEIVDQVLLVKRDILGVNITHIVFMGIGEPLDNLKNVLAAIKIINSPSGFDIGKRRITISTCGIIPQILKLSKEHLRVELSISLHSPDEIKRSLIMPINKKYPLKELIAALREYQQISDRQITFEYILIKNLNTDKVSALKLKKLLSGLDYKLNLINFNKITGVDLQPATSEEKKAFTSCLKELKIRFTLRKPRGQDILAACGQLRANNEK
jgi:23S rRNA (adenine2503-C2)-methyltransferase